jgi:hypothetical protein
LVCARKDAPPWTVEELKDDLLTQSMLPRRQALWHVTANAISPHQASSGVTHAGLDGVSEAVVSAGGMKFSHS